RAADSLSQMLASQTYQNYAYGVVLRDLDTLAGGLANLDQDVRAGATRDRLQWDVQALSDTATRVGPQLQNGGQSYYTRLYWQSVESSLDQVRSTLGVATYAPPIAGPLNGNIGGIGSVPASGSTTYLRPTPLHESLLPLADQATSQIDIFLA